MKKNEFSMKEALSGFLDKSRLKQGIDEVRIRETWDRIMGRSIAKYTSSLNLKGSTLTISTQVGALRQELSYSREKIIRLLNEELGEEIIKEVVIG